MSDKKQPEYLLPRTYSDTNSQTKKVSRLAKQQGFKNRSEFIRYLVREALVNAGML